jgi:hypothetical protein
LKLKDKLIRKTFGIFKKVQQKLLKNRKTQVHYGNENKLSENTADFQKRQTLCVNRFERVGKLSLGEKSKTLLRKVKL